MSDDKISERRAAELSKKNLNRADLTRQNLIGANLVRANLRGANLRDANLSGTNLSSALLNGADFSKADTKGTDFRNTNLCRVRNLTMAQIRAARVDETTKLPRSLKEQMPQPGSY